MYSSSVNKQFVILVYKYGKLYFKDELENNNVVLVVLNEIICILSVVEGVNKPYISPTHGIKELLTIVCRKSNIGFVPFNGVTITLKIVDSRGIILSCVVFKNIQPCCIFSRFCPME
jgi:hypothetical protein